MLPRIIEYLLSIRHPRGPNGRAIAAQGVMQVLIPILPANVQLVSQTLPFGSEYMDIIYETTLDPQMVPGALFGYAQYYGNRPYQGVFSGWLTNNNLYSYVTVTANTPAQSLVRNITNMNQYYAANVFYLTIQSKDDYNLALKYLDALITDKNSLEIEAGNLVAVMRGGVK